MDDAKFAHMLKLSAVFVPVMQSREVFDGVDEMDDGDRRGILTCLSIVADTFMEMQRRLNVKPRFRVQAGSEPSNG